MGNIIIKSGHLELLLSPDVQDLMKKDLPSLFGYQLSRIIEKLEEESKQYFKAKQLLIDKYSDKEKSDILPDGKYTIDKNNVENFVKESEELSTLELNLGISKIKVKVEELPEMSQIHWKFLNPFIKVIDE